MTDTNSDDCPNCGQTADYVTDTRPFEKHYIYCNECGLIISPKLEYMTLKELNEERSDLELPLLKKLPKQRKYDKFF